jgi:hypothetical protein
MELNRIEGKGRGQMRTDQKGSRTEWSDTAMWQGQHGSGIGTELT